MRLSIFLKKINTTYNVPKKGYKSTDEHKRKIKMALIGRRKKPFTEKHKRNLSEARKGFKHSEEAKKKIGDAHRGIPRSVEVRKKISLKHKGKKLSLEHKKKLSLAKLGKKLSENHRKKISEIHITRKEKNHLWRGGITPINKKIRQSLEYKLWRESVFKRDNYTCIWCGDGKGGNLNADHIKPFALFPELRFVIDNGRTLCVDCHKKTDTYLNRWHNQN